MKIVLIGFGRMAQGIAITFSMAGYPVKLVDLKKRNINEHKPLREKTIKAINKNLNLLYNIKLIKKKQIELILKKITLIPPEANINNVKNADIIFECVPEKLNIKKHILQFISDITNNKTIITSTTSSILSTDLAKFIKHPERFLNAHWLNPPFLMPLIELSPCNETSNSKLKKIDSLFKNINKVTVLCKASPGYIVPRIQALAMNEAAKILEEKTANTKDIDMATIYGFGIRFATLGLIEFIDWGGIDTLNNASDYMTNAMKDKKFKSPKIVKKHINDNNLGLASGSGFLDWKNIDANKFQQDKLIKFIKILQVLDIKPKIKI